MTYENNTKNYLREVKRLYSTGETREESFYHLIKEFFASIDSSLRIVINPSNRGWGFPDIFIMNDQLLPVGYIECKALFTDLDQELETDQLKRYKQGFPNLILTDYLNFCFLFPSESKKEVKLQTQQDFLQRNTWTIDTSKWAILIDEFLSYVESVSDPQVLAQKVARKALFLKEIFLEDVKSDQSSLLPIYEDFKKELDHTLTKSMFIDEITQLLCYGSLITRFLHVQFLPNIRFVSLYMSNLSPLMAQLSYHLMSPTSSFYDDLERLLSDIIYLLNSTDISAILSFDKMLFHFYETFLKEYNPKLREERSVYITPNAVVKFIVKSIDYFLRYKFGKNTGFLANNIKVLDPAAGTLRFIVEIYQILYDKLAAQNNLGLLQPTIKEHSLKNFFAFEILLAPYAIAHLNLLLKLKEYGVTTDQKVPVFLTNTLTLTEPKFQSFLNRLSIEGERALQIKTEEEILVILGNPPYRENSVNDTAFWRTNLKDAVYHGLNERNPKSLRADYIKFIRWAIWKINQSNKGIIGFITNHRFLDGDVTRVLRKFILDNFQEIFIINLHGDKREDILPEGIIQDQNVFNIQIGVCIFFLIKNPTENRLNQKLVKYIDLWGTKFSKEEFLISNHIQDIGGFLDLEPIPPLYLFRPVDNNLSPEYNKYPSIEDIFIQRISTMKTHRDLFLVASTKVELEQRLINLLNANISNGTLRDLYPDPKPKRNSLFDNTSSFNLEGARGKLLQRDLSILLGEKRLTPLEREKSKIILYNYRPFDYRYLYENTDFIDRPRKVSFIYEIQPIPTILTGKMGKQVKDPIWALFGYSSIKTDTNYFTRGGAYGFPLYFTNSRDSSLQSNIKPEFLNALQDQYDITISEEKIFDYVLAILTSEYYRIKYNELLKLKFPRIWFANNYDCFDNISNCGSIIKKIFELDEQLLPTNLMANFPVAGTNIVECTDHWEEDKVFINDDQHFSNVPNDIFNFYIGGYIVLQQWLKDRLEKTLTITEINNFRKIVASLKLFQSKIQEIDQILEDEFDQD